MKKIFGLVVMAMSMLFAANAMASTSVESVTAVTSVSDYEGDYVGQISNVTMNGKSYDSESATFTLEGNVLYCDFPQIGKMPGTIAVELPVTVDETTGKITAKKDAYAEKLTLKIGRTAKLYLDSLTNAKVENGTLEFDMAVHGTYLSIIKFPASFHFKGTLK